MGNLGVKGAMCKILEFLDQNQQRNNWSKLATFDAIFQLPHSALFPNSSNLYYTVLDYVNVFCKSKNYCVALFFLQILVALSLHQKHD